MAPIPPITWVGRDAVGNLVDVTAETDTLTSPYEVEAAGDGGLTVDNQFDPPAEVTTLIIPRAVIDGSEARIDGGQIGEPLTIFVGEDVAPGTVVFGVQANGAGAAIEIQA